MILKLRGSSIVVIHDHTSLNVLATSLNFNNKIPTILTIFIISSH